MQAPSDGVRQHSWGDPKNDKRRLGAGVFVWDQRSIRPKSQPAPGRVLRMDMVMLDRGCWHVSQRYPPHTSCQAATGIR